MSLTNDPIKDREKLVELHAFMVQRTEELSKQQLGKGDPIVLLFGPLAIMARSLIESFEATTAKNELFTHQLANGQDDIRTAIQSLERNLANINTSLQAQNEQAKLLNTTLTAMNTTMRRMTKDTYLLLNSMCAINPELKAVVLRKQTKK